MKYEVGQKVKIKSLDWYNKNKDYNNGAVYFRKSITFVESMSKYCGQVATIIKVTEDIEYKIDLDNGYYSWTDEMIEGLVEEEDLIPKFGEYSDNEPLNVPKMTTEFIKEIGGLPCPEGYIFKDENGNVINATKIVLEKKNGYPKTYEECSDILSVYTDPYVNGYKGELLWIFQKLLVCRDAYWKIAGDEMGLGKPWKPDWENPDHDSYPTITRCGGKIIKTTIYTHDCPFSFPTEEMRDAFYENFKEEIESCKEFL